MRSVGSPLAMSTVLGGTFAQQVICREGPYRSERDDEFLQISVDVKGKGSLEKSLESYVQVRARCARLHSLERPECAWGLSACM